MWRPIKLIVATQMKPNLCLSNWFPTSNSYWFDSTLSHLNKSQFLLPVSLIVFPLLRQEQVLLLECTRDIARYDPFQFTVSPPVLWFCS